jgi:hypothetical protein
VVRHVKDQEDAEEVLRPAEEVGDEAFVPRGGGEDDGPFEASLRRLVGDEHDDAGG